MKIDSHSSLLERRTPWLQCGRDLSRFQRSGLKEKPTEVVQKSRTIIVALMKSRVGGVLK